LLSKGFFFISNYFREEDQAYWINESLFQYTKLPNGSNLWNANSAQIEKSSIGKNRYLDIGKTSSPDVNDTNHSTFMVKQPIGDTLKQKGHALSVQDDDTRFSLDVISRIRWVTLGYQYNWTQRAYQRENYVPFPQNLTEEGRYS